MPAGAEVDRRRSWRRSESPVLAVRPLPLFGILSALALLPVTLAACVSAEHRASGRVFSLPRHQPDDGLAVVTRPRGEGLHLWLDTDTGEPGWCRPRWNPDAARLRGGDGPSPTSSGRASRQEFYAAMARGRVRLELRRHFEALCRRKAPRRSFAWTEPPRRPQEFRPPPLARFEEEHLLSHPNAIRRAEKQLLGLPLIPADWRDERQLRPPDGP